MQVCIQSERFSAVIDSFGAELQSVKNRIVDKEYIWQRDAAVWERSAPILFPVVGRTKKGVCRFVGESYSMLKHGFAWTSEFVCAGTGPDFADFVLRDSESTRSVYPFEFKLKVRFRCLENGLFVHYTVTNPSSNPLWFTLGSHPAFVLQSEPEDYQLRFSRNETQDLYGSS